MNISSSENNKGEYLHRVVQIQSRVEVENGDCRRESESFSTHNILQALVIIIGLQIIEDFLMLTERYLCTKWKSSLFYLVMKIEMDH